MKTKLIIGLLLSITLYSCDNPRSSRSFLTATNNSGSTFTGNSTTGTTPTSSPTPTSSNTTNSNFPTDVSSSCTFSSDGTSNFSQSSNHAGSYNLCKSSTTDSVFYFQIKDPPKDTAGNSVQLCFIPMTTNGTNSIYIGNPMCGYFTSSTTIKKLTFVKYTAYANATVTAVMFFKDTSYYYSAFNGYVNTLTAFQSCMNALYYGNTTYCNSFKSVGQYVYQTF